MIGPILALSLIGGPSGAPSRLDRLRELLAPAPVAASVVVLDCRLDAETLSDCRALGQTADGRRVAEAIRLAGAITPPTAMLDSGTRRVKVRLNIAP